MTELQTGDRVTIAAELQPRGFSPTQERARQRERGTPGLVIEIHMPTPTRKDPYYMVQPGEGASAYPFFADELVASREVARAAGEETATDRLEKRLDALAQEVKQLLARPSATGPQPETSTEADLRSQLDIALTDLNKLAGEHRAFRDDLHRRLWELAGGDGDPGVTSTTEQLLERIGYLVSPSLELLSQVGRPGLYRLAEQLTTLANAVGAPADSAAVCRAGADSRDAEKELRPGHVYVVFDGPPSSPAGRFVEVETAAGESVRIGTWEERDDGYWTLGPVVAPEPGQVSISAEHLELYEKLYGAADDEAGAKPDIWLACRALHNAGIEPPGPKASPR